MNKIPDTERNRKILELVEKDAVSFLNEPVKSLLFSDFKLYYETGSRTEYEDEYMLHRKRLNVMTAMALSSDDKKWIYALEDILWAICDEYTWEFPAHIGKNSSAEDFVTSIGLFAAETGFALAEICYLLGDELNKLVYDRVQYELRRRIINPYIKTDMQWGKDNWSAVCGGAVGCTIMYCGTNEEFELVKKRLLNSMDKFLSSYNDDGCCLEGMLYWGYGFSYFCFFAHMLREYTHGEINLFENKKVKKIAMFPSRVYISGDDVIPYADTPHNFRYSLGLLCFLKREYEEIELPPACAVAEYGYDKRNRFADFIRSFYWCDEDVVTAEKSNNYFLFEKSQWYILRKDKYFFSAKGGTNDEPHNHNDMGGFIIYSKNKYLIDDLGWPDYDSNYFSENRYENLCASSFGHSVPIINGQGQAEGEKHKAEIISSSENELVLNITAAYALPQLQSVKRKFVFNDDNIILTDSFKGEISSITERFVTRVKPIVKGNRVIIDDLTIEYDTENIRVTQDTFKPRLNICDMNMKPVEDVYLIDCIYGAAGEVNIKFILV